jgi:hypothetical protein
MTSVLSMACKYCDKTLENAFKTALTECKEPGDFVAPMPYLMQHFSQEALHTANSEEITGIDKFGAFAAKNEPVVITIHGGIEGCGILTPAAIAKAKQAGLTQSGAADLSKVFGGRDVVSQLLNDKLLPSGEKIPVFSYKDYAEQGMPPGNIGHAVVRSLALAAKVASDDYPISQLHDHSQVIVYAGGKKNAKEFLDGLAQRDSHYNSVHVRHPFGSTGFMGGKSLARILFVRAIDWEPGMGDYEHCALDGYYNLNEYGLFSVVKKK